MTPSGQQVTKPALVPPLDMKNPKEVLIYLLNSEALPNSSSLVYAVEQYIDTQSIHSMLLALTTASGYGMSCALTAINLALGAPAEAYTDFLVTLSNTRGAGNYPYEQVLPKLLGVVDQATLNTFLSSTFSYDPILLDDLYQNLQGLEAWLTQQEPTYTYIASFFEHKLVDFFVELLRVRSGVDIRVHPQRYLTLAQAVVKSYARSSLGADPTQLNLGRARNAQ